MSKKQILSFFEFMQLYPHTDPARKALAAALAVAVKYHADEIYGIDSLVNMMALIPKYVKCYEALPAIKPTLWCEYCTIAGRPIFEEYISNEPNRKCRKRNTE